MRGLDMLSDMYVIDLSRYLDEKGSIAPDKGPARKFADFLTAVVAHASDFDRAEEVPGPLCFKCLAPRKRDARRHHIVETGIAQDEFIVLRCHGCGTQGRISNWQKSFWDLGQDRPSDGHPESFAASR